MDFPAVLARLNDVPSTFRRDGPPYTQLIESIASAMAVYTDSSDATSVQVQSFPAAVDGWLDVWGLLWGVPRNAGEANNPYATRITRTVLAWVGTLPALQQWAIFYAPGASVIENANGLGYNFTLPPSMTNAQVTAFLISLDRIRPAGVPFSVTQIGGGLFLGTVEFLGTGNTPGNYLSSSVNEVAASIPSSTPNSVPLLPTLLFSDPTINPVYAPPS